MEIKTIYEDDKTIVEAVFLGGRFLFTVTYYLDQNDSKEHRVRVWNDGTVQKE